MTNAAKTGRAIANAFAAETVSPKYVTISNWCAMCGIGRSTTYKLLNQGHLPAKKVAGRTLIDADAGLAWLRAQPDYTAATAA
jgi:excisionase family DNA binding protein